MPVTPTGWFHFVLAIAAIAAGAAITIGQKGTPRHRLLGRMYGLLLLGVNVTGGEADGEEVDVCKGSSRASASQPSRLRPTVSRLSIRAAR